MRRRLDEQALESVFQQHGYVVAHTRSGAQTLELARLATHDLLVLDESLADVNALEVCRAIVAALSSITRFQL